MSNEVKAIQSNLDTELSVAFDNAANIITKIYYKIKKDRQGNTYEKQSERRRGYIREIEKFEARRWKCVGSAPTKWIFVFVVIVSAFPCDYSKNRHIAVKMQETMQ